MDMKNFTLTKHDPDLVGLIECTDHKTLAVWAIDCFNHGRTLVDHELGKHEEAVIETALATLRLWIDDKLSMWEARKYCWTVLSTARDLEKTDKVACQLLRACSHTLATCHVPAHAEGPCMYIVSAISHKYGKGSEESISLMGQERAWQVKRLTELKNT